MEKVVEYRRLLFEKTDLVITVDGSHYSPNDEIMWREFSFVDGDSTPQPLEDVLLAPPAPANEEHPPGSGDEYKDSDEKRRKKGHRERRRWPRRRRGTPAPRNPHGVRRGKLSTCRHSPQTT